jgi:hypothetical protein
MSPLILINQINTITVITTMSKANKRKYIKKLNKKQKLFDNRWKKPYIMRLPDELLKNIFMLFSQKCSAMVCCKKHHPYDHTNDNECDKCDVAYFCEIKSLRGVCKRFELIIQNMVLEHDLVSYDHLFELGSIRMMRTFFLESSDNLKSDNESDSSCESSHDEFLDEDDSDDVPEICAKEWFFEADPMNQSKVSFRHAFYVLVKKQERNMSIF